MDRTMPTIMDNIKFLNSDIARKIRSTPDFVVQDATNGDLFYVEVKYRKNGNFSLEEIGVDFPYKNAIFIVVSKNDIQWIAFEHLLAGQYLGEKSIRHIENCPHFRLDGAIVAEYKEYARNFFSNVD